MLAICYIKSFEQKQKERKTSRRNKQDKSGNKTPYMYLHVYFIRDVISNEYYSKSFAGILSDTIQLLEVNGVGIVP